MRKASRLYGNPGSIHSEGLAAKTLLEESRREVAEALDALSDEVIFAGSATESLNLAILGAVRAWKQKHAGGVPRVVVSAIEHAAVLEAARSLETEGAVVLRIPVRADGRIDLSALAEALREETTLVAVMYANNETGNIQPIREVAKLIREARFARGAKTREELAYPLFLTDACQAAQYLDISVRRLGVDLLVFNAAKIGGPKGASVLFRRRPVPIAPLIFGGGQERGFRAGTEDVVTIAGLSEALRIARRKSEREARRVAGLRFALEKGLTAEFPDMHINGKDGERLPNFTSVTFPGVDHENLVVMLDAEGIAVSTKSACNETEAEESHVLRALRDAGDGAKYPPTGIRISLGATTTAEDVRRTLAAFRRIRSRMRPLV